MMYENITCSGCDQVIMRVNFQQKRFHSVDCELELEEEQQRPVVKQQIKEDYFEDSENDY